MKWSYKIAVALVCASGAAQSAIAGRAPKLIVWEPSQVDWGDDLPSPTAPKPMIVSLMVADFPVTLEETSLEDARAHFAGTIGNRGDAGTAENWVCLHGNDASGPWILWLSSFEIDGPRIGGFQWRRLAPNETADARCPSIAKSENAIELPLAIHPGIRKSDALKILGQPTVIRGETLIYLHNHQEIINNQPYDALNSLALVVHGGTVWAIEVIKSTVS
jgi:6,7-dimethyl-8-ribityllumazine synthase